MPLPSELPQFDETSPAAQPRKQEPRDDRRSTGGFTEYILGLGTSARASSTANVTPFPTGSVMAEARPEARTAILKHLYDERRSLTRKRRLRETTDDEIAFLQEVNTAIDVWEAEEEAERMRPQDDALRRLAELTERLVAIKTNEQ